MNIRALFTLMLAGAMCVNVYAVSIEVGAPAIPEGTESVKDEFEVVLNSGIKKTVTVVVKRSDSAEEKAFRIQVAMQLNGVDAQFAKDPKTGLPSKTMLKLDNATSVTQAPAQNRSKEPVKLAALSGALDANIMLAGLLTGIDKDGNASVFHFEMGFTGLLLKADFAFAALPNNTIDSLLTNIFTEFSNDLDASPFRGALELDLSAGSISFVFPTGQSNYFVESYSSDTGAQFGAGIATVDEPSILALLLIVGIGYWSIRTRAKYTGKSATPRNRSADISWSGPATFRTGPACNPPN